MREGSVRRSNRIYASFDRYQGSTMFSNSMKVLRAIGKGDIDIAITHDLQMISSLEADRRQIRQNEPYISPLRIASPIDELSYNFSAN